MTVYSDPIETLKNLIFNRKLLGETDEQVVTRFSTEWDYTEEQVKQAIQEMSDERTKRIN